jgi:branched-chain amino acid transport system permease protein
MAVGAYACYKLMTAFPEVNIFFVVILSGRVTALVGDALRAAVAADQGLLSGGGHAGRAVLPGLALQQGAVVLQLLGLRPDHRAGAAIFGVIVTGPNAERLGDLPVSASILRGGARAGMARNLTRGRIGRSWMAIRDMDIAAEIIGVNPLRAKLSAFAVSSFFIGHGRRAVLFGLPGRGRGGRGVRHHKSFLVLFMIIIGGLGSIFGSFLGAAFLVLMPVLLKNFLGVGLLGWPTDVCRAFPDS